MSSNDTNKEAPATDAALDKDFEAMQQASGSTIGDHEPAKPPEETPAPPAQKPPEQKPPNETPAPPSPIPPAPKPGEEGRERTPVAPKPGEGSDGRERPHRYIPMKQYHDEKREWSTEKQTLLTTIAKAKGFEPGSEDETKAITDFATKANISEEAARAALDLARQSLFPKEEREAFSKLLTREQQEEQTQAEEAKQKEESEFFAGEFTPFDTEHLVTTYPNATDAQKAKARELMEQLSYTRAYARNSLEEIFAMPKHRKQFDDIFAAEATPAVGETPPAPLDRKGPEVSKPGGHQASTLKASDFKPDATTKRYDFARLHDMPTGEDKDTLVSSLEPDAYVAYIEDLGSRESDIEVRRGGQRVTLR